MPEILFEDNHVLVVNKPAGLLTQPSGTDQDSLESQMKEWIKKRDSKPGNVFLEAVHRLDKPASGIVVFAKTSKALSRLQASIREKQCRKHYLALTEKVPAPLEADLEHNLIHDDYRARIGEGPNSKKAKLHYRVIKEVDRQTLLEVDLITGRYHQIRAQMSAIGCPIVGDKKYGAKTPSESIALHHYLMQIPHPTTKEMLTIEAPYPKHWPISFEAP